MVLEGKAVKEYSGEIRCVLTSLILCLSGTLIKPLFSAPMTVEWDKESLQQNGKADVKFEFLPPPELITAKNEKSVALKICVSFSNQ